MINICLTKTIFSASLVKNHFILLHLSQAFQTFNCLFNNRFLVNRLQAGDPALTRTHKRFIICATGMPLNTSNPTNLSNPNDPNNPNHEQQSPSYAHIDCDEGTSDNSARLTVPLRTTIRTTSGRLLELIGLLVLLVLFVILVL
jgi:hypothetical protein